ncbi:putative calcium-regulated heat stable protein 1-like [Scophthalmus maximus]|uniref:Putative calcium-regulated heat stable protein 1-like n=1 Tax=Scophthalmus maximus TaxID=52904 RepID=A0A2U9CPG1_SCOMX|nr:putative calcium-regulated heat stable protein 1-like [Scophthalmus maximus]
MKCTLSYLFFCPVLSSSGHAHPGVKTNDPSADLRRIPTLSTVPKVPAASGLQTQRPLALPHEELPRPQPSAHTQKQDLLSVRTCTVHLLTTLIEGEYVPVEGDEMSYKVCSIPPKYEKVQAVEVTITHLNPGTKHETWAGHIVSS